MYIEKMKLDAEQQVEKEEEYSPVRGCMGQLFDIVGQSEQLAQLVCEDFAAGRTIKECERKIKEFVDKNHKGNCGYCPPKKAEEIIREFFGLGDGADNKMAAVPQKAKIINLADLL